jgi:hypothetical protein
VPEEFDSDWYLRRHPDVAASIAREHFRSAFEHYERFGIQENRAGSPRSPRFVVHAGPHKTASTYIQKNLQYARNHLLNHGVKFPRVWQTSKDISHRALFDALDGSDIGLVQSQIDHLTDDDSKQIIISSEDLSLLSIRSIDMLASVLAPFDADIVFYYRSWPERLPSLWKQRVMDGGIETFPDFLAKSLINPPASYSMNTASMITRWAEVFGKSKVKIVPYNAPSGIGSDDIFMHFLETIVRIPTEGVILDREPAHVSPGVHDIEILRALNSISRYNGNRRDISYAFLSGGGQYDTSDFCELMDRHISSVHIDNSVEPWRRLEYDFRVTFEECIVPRSNARELFARSYLEHIYVTTDYMYEAHASELIARLWHDISTSLPGSRAERRTDRSEKTHRRLG